MSRVVFDDQPLAPQLDPARADIACFVGLVRLLAGAALPPPTVGWLTSLGYSSSTIAQVLNVPVMLERYSAFMSIFDDGGAGSGFGTDYLAATVRSFFAQGGKRCYVVRVGDPLTPEDNGAGKASKLAALLPNLLFAPDQADSWTGVSNLAALQDVSFLVTPDLPILCASQQYAAVGQDPAPASGPEQFVECSQGDITPQQYRTFPSPAPRLGSSDYQGWATCVAAILNYLSSGNTTQQPHLREIHYIAPFPIPLEIDASAAIEMPSSSEIAQDIHNVIETCMPEIAPPDSVVPPGNILSSFLQLAYPWLKTSGSSVLLESLEPPDGALAGLLARNALTRGTFTSATKVTPAEIYDVSPALPGWETRSSDQPLVWNDLSTNQQKPLIERISLFGFTPGGLRLLSDVTAYPGETVRSGAVSRLVSIVWRAARRIGESAVFQNNGPALWGRVQGILVNLLTRLWSLNALAGATVKDAFSVRCDRSTMTQNDLDNGRLICLVSFTPAFSIEVIQVQLAMETSGTSSREILANLVEAS